MPGVRADLVARTANPSLAGTSLPYLPHLLAAPTPRWKPTPASHAGHVTHDGRALRLGEAVVYWHSLIDCDGGKRLTVRRD